MPSRRTRLIAALDTADAGQAEAWVELLGAQVDALKFGLEFSTAHGPLAARRLAGPRKLFLDLKLHDIPNTVAAAVRALSEVWPEMLTLHAQGGPAMLEAAREARDSVFGNAADRPLLLAVTVLTSLDAVSLHATGVAGGPRQQVMRLGRLAMTSGADGLVCSPQEIELLRDAFGEAPILVVPGIRPEGAASDDQRRTMSAAAAHRAGADWIVVGRPITRSADPLASARQLAAELNADA